MAVTDRLNAEQKRDFVKLFGIDPSERKDRLTVRFSVLLDGNGKGEPRFELYKGDSKRNTPGNRLEGATVTRYIVDEGARTPTGGKYTRRGITVRTRDGRTWYGTIRKDSDVVKLRLAKEEKTANSDAPSQD
jgi:hypothetical protein